jgi:hypothetical protein
LPAGCSSGCELMLLPLQTIVLVMDAIVHKAKCKLCSTALQCSAVHVFAGSPSSSSSRVLSDACARRIPAPTRVRPLSSCPTIPLMRTARIAAWAIPCATPKTATAAGQQARLTCSPVVYCVHLLSSLQRAATGA